MTKLAKCRQLIIRSKRAIACQRQLWLLTDLLKSLRLKLLAPIALVITLYDGVALVGFVGVSRLL